MNRLQRAFTASFFGASFIVFGVAHAQISESSGVPYIESQERSHGGNNVQMVFSTVPANTLRVIKMVNCMAQLETGTQIWVTLGETVGPGVSPSAVISLPMVATVPLGILGPGTHLANSSNNVFYLVPSGTYPLLSVRDAKNADIELAGCTLIGYDVPSPGLKVGGPTD
jgi:hypothetical protein